MRSLRLARAQGQGHFKPIWKQPSGRSGVSLPNVCLARWPCCAISRGDSGSHAPPLSALKITLASFQEVKGDVLWLSH